MQIRQRSIGCAALILGVLLGSAHPRAEVDESGAYTIEVPIEVPDFHGLEPDVRLAYNSTRGNDIAGMGWTLQASSYIVRGSEKGGPPRSYGSVIFLLDGMELIACDRVPPGANSPSCATGGTHTTRVESFIRVQRDGDLWYVWAKDGTKSTYAPQQFGGGSWDFYRWALTERENTLGQKAIYTYWCDSGLECYLQGDSLWRLAEESVSSFCEVPL